MKKIILFISLLIIPFVSAQANHLPEHVDGDEIDHRYYNDKDISKYKLPESYSKDRKKILHSYGYFSTSYTHQETPLYYFEQPAPTEQKSDNYSLNKLYLVNVMQFTDSTVWDTIIDWTYRDYKRYKALDDSYFTLQSGPSFLLPDNNTKITAKLSYGNEMSYHKKLFDSVGAVVKINHSFFNNFNTTLDTEIEKRNYNMGITNETDRYVYSAFLINRFYLYQKHVLKFTPLYRYFNTKEGYQDKDVYGCLFNYTYFPQSTNFYFGLGYNYLKTAFRAPEPAETHKEQMTENEYSAFIGYNFYESLSLQFSYAYKEIKTNEPEVLSGSKDNSFSLSLVYKFHIL
jgi:hypothetical protein